MSKSPNLRSSSSSKLGLVLTLSLIFLSFAPAPEVKANIFTDIGDGVCATLVTGASTSKCYDEFTANYKGFNVEDDKVPEYVACCGVSIMKSCLEDAVAEKCGESAKTVAASMTQSFLRTTNKLSGEPLQCDWDAWYFDRKSPVCWPIWGQVVGGISILFILLIACGSCCCSLCCGRSRRSGTTYYPVVKPRV